MSTDETIKTIKILREEVEVLTKRLRPAGTGHLHTAIGAVSYTHLTLPTILLV